MNLIELQEKARKAQAEAIEAVRHAHSAPYAVSNYLAARDKQEAARKASEAYIQAMKNA